MLSPFFDQQVILEYVRVRRTCINSLRILLITMSKLSLSIYRPYRDFQKFDSILAEFPVHFSDGRGHFGSLAYSCNC